MAKKKSLMDALSDYQGEHGYGPKAKGAVKGQGPVKDGKTYGKLLIKNKEEDKGGPKGVLAPKHGGKPPTAPPPVSRGGGTSKPKSTSGSSSGSSGGSGGTAKPQSGANKNPFRNKSEGQTGRPRVGQVRDGKKWNGKRWVPVTSSARKPKSGRNARRGTAFRK